MRTRVIIIVLIFACTAAWAAADLWGRSTSLRQFDPDEVATLETQMWRSYYDKERLRLFNELSVLLRRQYHMPLLRSYVVAFHAAKAAFVFKDGTKRSDCERALPDLVDYYAAIRRISDSSFDVQQAARLELEWWIVHRQRAALKPGDLENSLAALAGEIYQLPADRFLKHAKYRADAMILRDDRSVENGVSEADWQEINELLLLSWRSLWQAVNDSNAVKTRAERSVQ